MAIAEVRVYAVPLETQNIYTMSSSRVATPVSTIVALIDDDGTVGFGEACLATPHYQSEHNDGVRAALELLGPAMLGLEAQRFTVVNAAMDATIEGQRAAKAALDIACWDLAAKQLGQPVVDMLGGARSDHVVSYHVVGIATPEEAAAEASALQDQGSTRLQLKTGGRLIHDDIASIRAVADVVRPGTDLAVDTNRGWSTVEALQVSNACASITMSLEQPCATEAELADVKANGHHPIVVDENATDIRTIARLITSGLANGFGLKLTRLGGLTAMRAVRDLCMASRVPMSSDDAWGGDIIAAAGVALGATLDPRLSRGAWISHPYHGVHYDDANGPRLDGGNVTLPAGGPGLGLVLDPDQFGEPVAVYR